MRQRLLNRALSLLTRRDGVLLGSDVVLFGRPIVSMAPGSTILVGDRVVLCSDSRRTSLGVSRPVILRTFDASARLVIGADSGLSGTTIACTVGVQVGERCLVGADVLIADTDFHPVDPVDASVSARRYASTPIGSSDDRVVIEDDVFLGARSIVLKGAHIGRGSVIGAGSVVSGIIPSGVVAAGAPARVVRSLRHAE